ncbi:glycosyltransferase [Levilactobacillus bambusae]|uniref:Glycosyl transferase family 1 n=1 Tax=Levilactobacillus bambusae TaxID=2024736 RepID=A0A2V1MZA5_9LACO|nr:glycosyltransferase [Levilactobacillus bambusae]PWF99475.1 glycosyl transferase family 1 [Levilactobacillus bambusae]
MIFFFNSSLQPMKSGIEHAELKRMQLFLAHQVPALILLRDWNPTLHKTSHQAGLTDQQILNMFDYFQGTQTVTPKFVGVHDIDFGVAAAVYDEDPDESRYLVYDADHQLLGRINYAGENHRVKSVELFDGFNNLYRVDHYDERGFLSLADHYTPDNKIGTETWYDLHGQPVIEGYHRYDMEQEWRQTGWYLNDVHDHKEYTFDTIEEFTRHFLDAVNADYWSLAHPNIFVMDRSHLADWGFLHLKRPAYTVFHLHNAQTGDAQNPWEKILNNNYEFSLNAMDGYDAVVSATKKQTQDVLERFQPRAHLFTIPVGVVSDARLAAKQIPVKKRQFGKMVVFARLAWEKRLDDLVRAVAIVKQTVPEVTLDLYGYADSSDNYKARRMIETVIKENHLEDTVHLKGYTTDIDAVENQAMMYGLTSRMEGFNLAILEAISHGLISFTYDVNYGPNEIVEDDVNGYVVPNGDYQALAKRMIEVLQNPKLAERLCQGAYDSAGRYSEAAVWQGWQSLMVDADRLWPAKLAANRYITLDRSGV